MSIFEAIMLLCFGSAWPFSIYKSYKSRNNKGKSLFFLIIVLSGYLSGVIHKLFYSYDYVIYLYILNFVMVFADIILYIRNEKINKEIKL
ncbi:MAG: hypothetical protein A3J83_02190 [Elusimicrobia bacterium RIFOXYA2_FULL_40_6]|nr:MAG: hypothetical protein A3J83_02190 [Elusimicrobia bacterium RIFOXYA2_FULL_40_6]